MKRTRLLTLLEDTMLFMILYSIVLVLLKLSNVRFWDESITPIFKSFVLYLFMLSAQAFRRKLNNLFAFSLGHICLIVLAFLLGLTASEKIIYTLFAFALTFTSFKTYLSETKNAYTFSLLMVGEGSFFLIFLIALFKNDTFLQSLLNLFSPIYIVLFMLYMHILHLDNSLEIITQNSIQPISAIRRFNNKIIGLFLLIAAPLLVFCKYLHIQDLIKLLWQGFTHLIHLLIYNQNAEELPELIYKQEGGYTIFDWVRFLRADAKTGLIAQFTEKLFLYVIDIGIVLLIISSIGYGLYLIYKNFYANASNGNETKEFISPFVKAKKDKKTNLFKDRMIPFSSTNNEKIRALYFKKIQYYMRYGLKISNNTSSEISQTAKMCLDKDLTELTNYYEKARYSNNEASKEDLIQIKSIASKLK